MLAKFSVKKPFTVLVCVVLVIILGFVSFSNMTPDLLPSIDLPYVVVMTTYTGASPEEVEQTVTKPLEKSMATLDGVASLSSTSSENYSMLMLQFEDGANLDTVSVDIREKINLVSGYWGENVGTPYILKINPNMLPVSVAAVDMEGKSTVELSSFLNDNLLPRLEGIEGVASVSESGMLEQTVSVMLRQEKIDAVNDRLRQAIDEQFAETEQELADKRQELEDGLTEAEDGQSATAGGRSQIEAAQKELAEQLAAAENELDDNRTKLLEGKQQILNGMQQLETALKLLDESEKQLLQVQSQLAQLQQSEQTLGAAVAQLQQLQTQIAALEVAKAKFDVQISGIQNDTSLSQEEKQQQIEAIQNSPDYLATQQGLAAVDQQLTAQGMTRADVPTKLAEAQAAYAQVQTSLQSVDQILAPTICPGR